MHTFLCQLRFLRLTVGDDIQHQKNQNPQQKPAETKNTNAQSRCKQAPVMINPLEHLFPNANCVAMF